MRAIPENVNNIIMNKTTENDGNDKNNKKIYYEDNTK